METFAYSTRWSTGNFTQVKSRLFSLSRCPFKHDVVWSLENAIPHMRTAFIFLVQLFLRLLAFYFIFVCSVDVLAQLCSLSVELCVPLCDCSLVSPLDAWRAVESDKRGQREKTKDRRAQTSQEMERKSRAEGRNSRPRLRYWLNSGLPCLFLLYFYRAVWHWSLMNGSICKLHFISQKSFRMSGSGGSVRRHDAVH